jgi:hypothetical protein
LDRYDFEKPFENETCIIRKGFMKSAGDIRATPHTSPGDIV